jgi:hypothetical protein
MYCLSVENSGGNSMRLKPSLKAKKALYIVGQCNAWKERLVNIWFVFRILEFVVNNVDFICVACFCMLAWWKILNLQLRYKFG